MPALSYSSKVCESFIRRHAVLSYFILTFAISWAGALLVAAPSLMRHAPLPKLTGILMFPAMLLGPPLAGIVLTQVVDGGSGLRDLRSRIFRWRIPARWYAALLIPPCLVLLVLLGLKTFLSPVYAPNRFFLGIFFGLPAGILEEIGWTGYAFPKLRSHHHAFSAGLWLGLLWAIWHLPVINFLGTATPHGSYWLAFFLVFALAMVAMRGLICWLYSNTQSVLLAQLMHLSSTASLVIFSAPRATPAQEVLWYGLYGTILWIALGLVVKIWGRDLIEISRVH